jgi:cell division septation protein DedD
MNDLMGEQRSTTSETAKSPRWGRRILTGMVALAAMGGFAMIVVFSYDKGKETGAVAGTPVIKAQQGPTKVKPEKPGGMPIRDQDKNVYDRLDPNSKKDKVENLLPAPEKAMSKPVPMKLPKISKKDLAKATAIEPAAGSNIMAPPPPPPIIAAPAKPAVNVPAIKPASVKPKIKKKMAEPVKSIKKPVSKNNTPIKKMAALKNGYRIQIASLKSKAAANTAWRKLQNKHPSLFGRLSPNIVRAVIPGKGTYYRLQAGTIKGQTAARALCSQAKKRKIRCLIVKPR